MGVLHELQQTDNQNSEQTQRSGQQDYNQSTLGQEDTI